ncbi:hypothetical protein KKE06_03065, partial [Candidatus Micrarchaeota archaeon]|nr:hypothetical protein [Candidatus Micrarchaeota archaeon]MBU1930526.1 hypothetical protein [Candidatus Micrarchaeota archaeon]
CMDLGYTSGSLACNSSCEFDESGCIGTPAQCGDGIKEGLEACDPPDYGMETCESLGFVSGDLHCKYDCSEITTWGCESCGNGLCESEYSEDFETCVDCSALCGNAICNLETGEDYGNCPADCDYLCGNGTCEPFYEENETNCVADCGACMPDTCEDLSQSIPCGLIVEPVCSTTIDCGECEYTQYECTEENECVCVPDITGICLESFGTDNCGIDMDFVCTQSVICGCPSGFTCTAGMARGPPAPTCAAITDGCQDDCAVSGIKRCLDADTIQECGNYDSDMCLEWGNAIECTAGENCVESVQNPFAMCRLP